MPEHDHIAGFPHFIYPAVSTKDCARSKSCYRLCPSGRFMCPGYAALYMATLSLTANNNSVAITLGGRVFSNDSYIALGVSSDPSELKGADISACHALPEGGVTVSHYLLDDVSSVPDLHKGKLTLQRQDSDSDQIWCSFERELKGDSVNSMMLHTPKHFLFFSGVINSSGLHVPPLSEIKLTEKLMMEEGYFNQVAYSNALQLLAPLCSSVMLGLLLSIIVPL
ncbi:DOMON domain [Trinorchestia longiramus]|nr:DOMON domain [Trinorchestia longiramus]